MPSEIASSGDFLERAQILSPAVNKIVYGMSAAINADTAFITFVNDDTFDFQVDVYVKGLLDTWVLDDTLTYTQDLFVQAATENILVCSASDPSVNIFEKDGGGVWGHIQQIDLPNPDVDFLQVMRCALSPDGAWLAVGVYNNTDFATNRGYVLVYSAGVSGYDFVERIDHPAGAGSWDQFGVGLAISNTGIMVIGAPSDDDFGSNDGRAFVYKEDGGSWDLDQTIDPPINQSSTGSGYTIAITPDGSKLAVADGKNGVAIYDNGGSSFTLDEYVDGPNSSGDTFAGISDDGLTVVHTNGGFDVSSTFLVYELGVSGWAATQTFLPPHTDEVYSWKSIDWLNYSQGNIIVSVQSRESGDGLPIDDFEVFIYSREAAVTEPDVFSDFWTGFVRSEERPD
jgi:hypothetical protein